MKATIKVYRGNKVIYKNKTGYILAAVREERAIIEQILNHTACVNLMGATMVELKYAGWTRTCSFD